MHHDKGKSQNYRFWALCNLNSRRSNSSTLEVKADKGNDKVTENKFKLGTLY